LLRSFLWDTLCIVTYNIPLPPPAQGATQDLEIGPSKKERTLAMVSHLLPLTGFLIPAIPILNIVAPLVLWLINKDKLKFLDDQGKEVLNFQITLSLVLFACFMTFWLIIPIAIAFVACIASLVFMIIGAIQANDGKAYRYLLSLRLVK
jgi:uncharacterized Tic20 family protein